VEDVMSEYGRLDILVTNASGPPPARFLELKPEDWQAAVELTLMGVVRLCYAALPHMRRQGGGSIVSMTSFTVKQPEQNLVLSNSIRLAVVGLTKTLANELGKDNIRMNTICPGWTRTQRVDQLIRDRAARQGITAEQEAENITGQIPLGRMGRPEEIANVVVFLASPAASYVHGVTLQVDGGLVKGVM